MRKLLPGLLAVILSAVIHTCPSLQAAPDTTGNLRGRFVLAGEKPKRMLVDVPEFAHSRTGEKIREQSLEHYHKLRLTDESLVVGDDGGLRNVIIWISDKNIPLPRLPDPLPELPPVQISFKDGRLQPHVVAWWAKSRKLVLQNDDPYLMNMRAAGFSGTDAINVMVPPGKPYRLDPGAAKLPVFVSSDVYYWVQPAIVFPCAHPYVAVTEADGSFLMEGVPTGNWEFRAWHERWGYLRIEGLRAKMITVNSGENQLGTVKVQNIAEGTIDVDKPQPANATSDWSDIREQRRQANDRGSGSEFLGSWRMTLPRGFAYDMSISQRDDGLLKLDSTHGINLRGVFACRGTRMELVEGRRAAIRDFVWEYRDGTFVLKHEDHGKGARYVGATMERLP